MTINPEDNFTLCATGDRYARCLKVISGSTMEEAPLLRRTREKFIAFRQHAWVGGQTIVAVTEDEPGQTGLVILYKNEVIQVRTARPRRRPRPPPPPPTP